MRAAIAISNDDIDALRSTSTELEEKGLREAADFPGSRQPSRTNQNAVAELHLDDRM